MEVVDDVQEVFTVGLDFEKERHVVIIFLFEKEVLFSGNMWRIKLRFT